MGTVLRPELSEKNKYWIDRHRYYELKHFCLQYPVWKKMYATLDGLSKRENNFEIKPRTGSHGDPTAKCAIAKTNYMDHINMIETLAVEADDGISGYLLKGITEGLSYEVMKARLKIPCSKEMYYDRYRKFFWLLSNARN
ncbi:MAG: hypothetical protein Q4C65_02665 [Eubacteriales bacterium]|nr:hypothetical protein [Eubacteriales bacterium]